MATFTWTAGNGNASDQNNWSPGGGPPMDGDTAILDVGNGGSYTATLDVNATVTELQVTNAFALLFIGAQALTVTGNTATSVLLSGGEIAITGGLLDAAGAGSGGITNTAILAGSGTVTGLIAGSGIYDASGGVLDLTGAVQGDAVGLLIEAGATLLLDGTVASGAIVTFNGATGSLALSSTSISGGLLGGFDGVIAGGTASTSGSAPTANFVDLVNIANSDIISTTVTGGGDIQVATIGGTFTLGMATALPGGTIVAHSGDGGSGSAIFIACFGGGTRVLTADGERTVEELAVGDLVMTLSGEAKPIKWLGRRSYAGRFVAGNRAVLPVRIAAGAIAEGIPVRELWLSPEHAVYVDGVLVPARLLVNGTSVVQLESIERIDYFHVELAAHDVIFAEQTASETYVDRDNRRMFQNAEEFTALYPDDERPFVEFCAPRLESDSEKLAELCERLRARADILGYRLTDDPDPRLVVDGVTVAPQAAVDRIYSFTIPASSRDIRLLTRSVIPHQLKASATDRRRLGVPLTWFVLRDANLRFEIGHGYAGLCDGFHPAETRHRWTDGSARLPAELLRPFAGDVVLEVHLTGSRLGYPLEPAVAAETAAA